MDSLIFPPDYKPTHQIHQSHQADVDFGDIDEILYHLVNPVKEQRRTRSA